MQTGNITKKSKGIIIVEVVNRYLKGLIKRVSRGIRTCKERCVNKKEIKEREKPKDHVL